MVVYGNACQLPDLNTAIPLESGEYLIAQNQIDNCDWFILVKSLNAPITDATVVVTVMRMYFRYQILICN
jgi:hypothetical protein